MFSLAPLEPLAALGTGVPQIESPLAPARPDTVFDTPVSIGGQTSLYHGNQAGLDSLLANNPFASQIGASESDTSQTFSFSDAEKIAQKAFNFGNIGTGKDSSIGAEIAYVLVGVILIAGGVFMFKQTQVIVGTVARHAKTAATLAA